MTQIDLEEWLTSSQGDTPASHSVTLESEEAIKMTDTSGQRCLQLSKRSDPIGSLEKMLLATSLWASTRCYLTWKPQATPAGALLFRLSPQTPDIGETDAGLWPTPTAHIHKEGGFPAEYNRNTPSLTAEATKADGKPHSSGSLNPQFVEWLMGYPAGYTDLNN